MSARVRAFLSEPLADEVARFVERIAHLPDVAAIAVMPDVHLAGEACVGTAIATCTRLFPAWLGGDLGCGVGLVPLGASIEAIAEPRTRVRILRGLARGLPILRRREPIDVVVGSASDPALDRRFEREGRLELGTLGRGNHFAEVQAARDGSLHLVVHSGSRSLGPAVQAHHLARCEEAHPSLVAASEAGSAYLHDVRWAIAIARANRDRLIEDALAAIGDVIPIAPDRGARVDRHHDGVARERHDVGEVYVHRKGAMALAAGERGVVPGSMGAPTFVVVGRGVPEALGSSAHGAGRAVPRGEARRRFDVHGLARSMRGICFDARRAGALLDESPQAYKDVRAVMRAQRELVAIEDELAPRIVHKGS